MDSVEIGLSDGDGQVAGRRLIYAWMSSEAALASDSVQ